MSRIGFQTITIPAGVTSIGDYAFQNCSSLASISLPEGITTIGYSAFWGCDSLTTINIADLAAWCELSYGYDSPLIANEEEKQLLLNGELIRNLVIPDGITKLNREAFAFCTKLETVQLPEPDKDFGCCPGSMRYRMRSVANSHSPRIPMHPSAQCCQGSQQMTSYSSP